MKTILTALFLLLLPGAAIAAEPQDRAGDRAAIERAALDYIEGWYTRDAARMERALHPRLVKRRVETGPANRPPHLDEGDAPRLVQATRGAPGEQVQALGSRRREVTLLDLFGNAASVKIDADGWIDYLHLVKWEGEWKILNVLWELRPE